MPPAIRYLIRSYLFWVLWFVIARWIFLLTQPEQWHPLAIRDYAMITLLGLRMDLSMAGYLLVLPGLMLCTAVWLPTAGLKRLLHSFNYVWIILTALVTVADLELYRHWGYRMDATPLLYLRPEGFGSVRMLALVKIVLILAALIGGGIWLYRRLVYPAFPEEKLRTRQIALPLLFTALLFIPIRSGFGIAPLNSGFVYYHPSLAFPNHAGINVSWNFFRSLVYASSAVYPEKLTDPETAATQLNLLIPEPLPSPNRLNAPRPNVLLIVLEGFSAKLIRPLGGAEGLTPYLSKACENGILFDRLYASGDRTDKGLVSILSGYPAQPRTSIVKYPAKTKSLPYWPRIMEAMGYHTTFVYGGDPRFANLESYLINAGFRHITRDEDFPDNLPRSKWGVHDEHLFRQLESELDTAARPFFKVALTLSSHEPFDVPFGRIGAGDSDEKLFLNSVRYTDSVLGRFLESAKSRSWWTNTLIVITADHGHRYPGNQPVMDSERFRIPMLWTGGAVADTTMVRKVASQVDIANTILHQLGNYRNDFRFSKDILAENTPAFAVYAYNNGYGYLSPEAHYIYDFGFGRRLEERNLMPEDERAGKSYMQMLFSDYNSR